MSTSELVRQLALARYNKVLGEQATGSGGVLLGGKFLARKHKKAGHELRKKRATLHKAKSSRKQNLYAELLHACGKKKARGDVKHHKYVKYAGLSGKARQKAISTNKHAINRCLGHKIRKGTLSKKKYLGKGMLMDPFVVPPQMPQMMPPYMMVPKPMPRLPRLMKQPMLGLGGEFDNPVGGYYSGGVYSGGARSGGNWGDFVKSVRGGPRSLSSLIVGKGMKKKPVRKSACSPWVTYVKHYAKAKGITYGEALKRAGPSYRKMYG